MLEGLLRVAPRRKRRTCAQLIGLDFTSFVIPAKAGIQGQCLSVALDPRLRGGDEE